MELADWAGIVLACYGLALLWVAIWMHRQDRASVVGRSFLTFAVFSCATWIAAAFAWIGPLHSIGSGVGTAAFRVLEIGSIALIAPWLRVAGLISGAASLRWITTDRGFAWAMGAGLTLAFLVYQITVVAEVPFFVAVAFNDVLLVAAATYVILAAVSARARTAADSPERRRANAYLGAFIVHDLSLLVGPLIVVLYEALGDALARDAFFAAFTVGGLLNILVFLPLVVYGATSGRIPGIEARVHRGFGRTAAAAIVGVLIVGTTESIEQLFSLQEPTIAIAVAIALAFAFRPVQDWAERGARRLLPAPAITVGTYQEAVRAALADGSISAREQRMLDDLAARLAR